MLSSSVTETDRTVSDVRVGRVIFCHRMVHFVLIRGFLQPSLAEALCWRDFFSIITDRTLFEVRVGSGYPVTAWRTSCLYGVSYSRASPRLFLDVVFVSNRD